jgi:ribosomal protein S18 acetylase RimI-like enzyme
MKPLDFLIREYCDSDYDSIVTLWKNLHLTRSDGTIESAAELHETLKYNPTTFIVVESGGKLIGSVIGTYDGRRGYIAKVGLDIQFQRKGIGKRVGAELIRRMQARGVKQMMGFVNKDNRNVLAFYEKFGIKINEDVIPVELDLTKI